LGELGRSAVHKPANPDMYSVEYATFVSTFARVLGDPALPHLFFVEGGALAVENALKVAFDWKSLRNERLGRPEAADMVMHLRHAFHGRSGYTLSLTNTDPVKVSRFPKFDWPRIESPALRFPLADYADENRRSEDEAIDQVAASFAANPYRIACFVAEPIQAEGGDRHLSARFLGAVQELCA
jgi:L-lysine 6-transaminase